MINDNAFLHRHFSGSMLLVGDLRRCSSVRDPTRFRVLVSILVDLLRLIRLLFMDSRGSSILPEVEPYIPFNINPTGMQPVLTTTYLMAVPSLVAGYVPCDLFALPGASPRLRKA